MATIDLPAGIRNSTMVDPPQGSPQNFVYLISRVWSQWLQLQIVNRLQSSPQNLQTLKLTGLHDTVISTPLALGTVASGVYRLSYFTRITTPAGTSSSVTPNFLFTQGGQSCTVTGDAVTGNSLTSVGSKSFLIAADQASPISYSVTYAINPAHTA